MGESLERDILSQIRNQLGEPANALNTISPLTFAFVGDAVYSLIMRTMVVDRGNTANGKLHSKTTAYVSARAQAEMADKWINREMLNDEEMAVLRRGINAKPHSVAKSASTYEYHRATGVETLAGYLYLKGDTARLVELIKKGLDV